ncbi:MAG: carbamoyltransferase HypF [Desulfotignum sp.]|nr:carbamoyltransferase HypF [Desulfotignum sp.]
MMPEPEYIASQLDISGVVQGVGFRPFLFSLAARHRIAGEVSNTASGVQALVEGDPRDLARFVEDITARSPLLARVDAVKKTPMPVRGVTDFQIIASRAGVCRATLISPDVSVCKDCLKELYDPQDRRFRYPFINCTNCGPRFTIIEDVPYDRPQTAMKHFVMCPACQAEYDDPADRRFHAQPNACPVCGPQVVLTDRRGRKIAGPDTAVETAGGLLAQGHVVAVKGLGGFHLAVDAANDAAVQRLRRRKHRPHKPLAVMAGSVSAVHDYVQVSPEEQALLSSFNRPIVLLRKKKAQDAAGLSPSLAPLNPCLGVMLPYTPLHFLLLEAGPSVLVMTSGNRPGEPLSIDNQDALDAFSHIADYFLLHNRDIYFRADDSIVRIQAEKPRFIRRSRGYAPLPIPLSSDLPCVLGCGAGMKNTLCLTRKNQAFVSQHIGDLDNQETFDFYVRTLDHFKTILDIAPEIVAHDLHPGYMSTQYAQSRFPDTMPRVGVQHHHAHAVSCMVENDLDEPVVAVVLDGTGYGTDGRIWGGEILIAERDAFVRKAHLRYLPMPGGDQAVRQPWRMAAAVLHAAFGRSFVELDLPFIKEMDPCQLDFICRMIQKQVNTPQTSSCGRLCDAVSSLLCIRHEISFDSQAAMELEALGTNDFKRSLTPYSCDVISLTPGQNGVEWVIDMIPGIREMVADIQAQVPAARISARFHQTLVHGFSRTARHIAAAHGLDKVVLSGGVFNNDLIFREMAACLKKNHLFVYTHAYVPAGDGGIALGQAAVAAAKLKHGRDLLKTNDTPAQETMSWD